MIAEFEFRSPDDISASHLEVVHLLCGEAASADVEHGENVANVISELMTHSCAEKDKQERGAGEGVVYGRLPGS